MSIALISGIILAAALVIMLVAGIPIAVTLCASSVLAVLPTLNFEAAVLTATQRIFSGISIFTLLAIPFFILAGNIMNKGGIAVRLIDLAKLLTGHIPGSLAQCNIVANMLFGAVSGSGVAAASAMGSIIGPIEEKEGYDPRFSASVNVATAPTGLLIPPSSALITYSLISGGTSVAALFMGGIIGGVFTATEGAAIAVAYSLILSILYKTITWEELGKVLLDSAKMTGTVVFLIGASNVTAWVMSFTGIPTAISSALLSISSNRIVIFLLINVFLLFVGTFMDITPTILIFTPIFLPICQSFGMSALQFGIMITYNLCIGTITPPVGNILFVGIKVAKLKLEEMIRFILPYYAVIVLVLLAVTFVPAVTLWLPSLAGYAV